MTEFATPTPTGGKPDTFIRMVWLPLKDATMKASDDECQGILS